MAKQSIQTLIQQQTEQVLPNLAQKIAQLQRLNELWQKYIDINLAKHTRVANWRDPTLIIEIDNANWATHVRYSLPELLIKLKAEKELAGLKYINWYIKPTESKNKLKPRKTKALSKENSQLLAEAAEHTPHEKLKDALLALAKHTDNS